MEKRAAVVARKEWLCPECKNPKPGTPSIDVTIQGMRISDPPLNFVFGFGVPLVRRDFLQLFGSENVNRDLYLGRVFSEEGMPIEEWVTFHGRHSLIIRGTKNVSHRICDVCHRKVYFAMGEKYLYPSPPTENEIFESRPSGLIVTQRLFDKLVLNRWPKLAFDKLPVLPAPKDGFAEF